MCFPVVESCSGHGTFNNVTGLCECFPGYTSLGDLRFNVGHDCDVSIVAIQVIYGVALCLYVIPMSLIVVHYWKQAQIHGWRFVARWEKPVTRSLHCIFLFCAFTMIQCCLKLARPEQYLLGTSVSLSVIYSIWQFFLWTSILLVMDLFVVMTLKTTSHQSNLAAKLVPFIRCQFFFALPPLLLSAFLILAACFYQDVGCDLTRASYYIVAINLLIVAFYGPIVFNIVLKDIRVALEASRDQSDEARHRQWETMYQRVTSLRRDMFIQPFINSVAIFIITSVPFFFDNLTYYEAVLVLILTVPAITVSYNLTLQKPTKNHQSSGPSKTKSVKNRMVDEQQGLSSPMNAKMAKNGLVPMSGNLEDTNVQFAHRSSKEGSNEETSKEDVNSKEEA